MKASVIVVTYNRGYILKHCVDKLLNQTEEDYELLVVDDGSTDNTEEIMGRINDDKFRYLENPENLGQPAARNRGIREAEGKIIIFVDSDVLVHPRFVEDHIKIHQRNERLIVQGLVRHVKKVEDYGEFNLLIDGLCLTGLITQNVSVRKKWMVEVGGFDESFGDSMGYMDVEMGRRLKEKGLRTVYAWRKCLAWHVDGFETDDRLKAVFKKSYDRGKNALKFSRMYGSKVAARHLKESYAYMISRIFGTEQWAEDKGVSYLISHRNSFLFPLIKWIIKYHYRAKGIRDAREKNYN